MINCCSHVYHKILLFIYVDFPFITSTLDPLSTFQPSFATQFLFFDIKVLSCIHLLSKMSFIVILCFLVKLIADRKVQKYVFPMLFQFITFIVGFFVQLFSKIKYEIWNHLYRFYISEILCNKIVNFHAFNRRDFLSQSRRRPNKCLLLHLTLWYAKHLQNKWRWWCFLVLSL